MIALAELLVLLGSFTVYIISTNKSLVFIFSGSDSEETKWFSLGAIHRFCICSPGSGLLQFRSGLHVRHAICYLHPGC